MNDPWGVSERDADATLPAAARLSPSRDATRALSASRALTRARVTACAAGHARN